MKRWHPLEGSLIGLLCLAAAHTGAAVFEGLLFQPVQLLNEQDCGRAQSDPAATWITNQVQLEALYRRVASGRVPAPPASQVDFDKEAALLVEMGQRPTAGYALEPAFPGAIVDRTARIELVWVEPPPDAIVAQVITSPCLLITLPLGPYTSISIVDQDGRERLRLPLQ